MPPVSEGLAPMPATLHSRREPPFSSLSPRKFNGRDGASAFPRERQLPSRTHDALHDTPIFMSREKVSPPLCYAAACFYTIYITLLGIHNTLIRSFLQPLTFHEEKAKPLRCAPRHAYERRHAADTAPGDARQYRLCQNNARKRPRAFNVIDYEKIRQNLTCYAAPQKEA